MKQGKGRKKGRAAERARVEPVEPEIDDGEELDDDGPAPAPRAVAPAPLPGESITRRVDTSGADSLTLAGVNDANLIELQKQSGAKVGMRGDILSLSGPAELVERALSVAMRMVDQTRQQQLLTPDDVLRMTLDGPGDGDGSDGTGTGSPGGPGSADFHFAFPGAKKVIRPKSQGQTEYLRLIRDNDIVVGIGPAGTGKTYLAVAAAVDALLRKRVRRIVLCRPAVEAGESLGFLPGDMQAKVDPYLRPLYDALDEMLPQERIAKALETRTIEIAPLAFMRGRTLGDAFVILDEAQNATNAQMKMFLTRLGVNSKIVITGDKTQVDLPRKEDSGLFQVERILPGIDGIGFQYFNETDVVRHRLVRDIIRAYAHDAGD